MTENEQLIQNISEDPFPQGCVALVMHEGRTWLYAVGGSPEDPATESISFLSAVLKRLVTDEAWVNDMAEWFNHEMRDAKPVRYN